MVTTFVTSWYTHELASFYLEGCNFLTTAVSIPTNSLVALHGAFGQISFMLRQFELSSLFQNMKIFFKFLVKGLFLIKKEIYQLSNLYELHMQRLGLECKIRN